MDTGDPYLADAALRAGLVARLRASRPLRADAPHARPAAVALVVASGADGVAELLLTRRAAGLRAHPGQWAFPGGSLDPGEDPSAGARRELREEIGVDLPGEEVLGLLDDYVTRSGYCITPVVLWAGPITSLAPEPREVDLVQRVTLRELDRQGTRRLLRIPESDRPVLQLRLASLGTVHAPTAAFLYQFRQVALHGRATRVAHLDQPVFAWR